MTPGRSTKAYRQLVKKIAKVFEYPPMRRVGGIGPYRNVPVRILIEEVLQEHPPHVVEAALQLVIIDSRRMAEFDQQQAREKQILADLMEAELHDFKKPKLSIVRRIA